MRLSNWMTILIIRNTIEVFVYFDNLNLTLVAFGINTIKWRIHQCRFILCSCLQMVIKITANSANTKHTKPQTNLYNKKSSK